MEMSGVPRLTTVQRTVLASAFACLACLLLGIGFVEWASRAWLSPEVQGRVRLGDPAQDPDSARFAYPVTFTRIRQTRGALSALGRRVRVGTRVDVLVYDFSLGGQPRRVFSKAMRRFHSCDIAVWNQQGIHLLYWNEDRHHHLIINPEQGTVSSVPLWE